MFVGSWGVQEVICEVEKWERRERERRRISGKEFKVEPKEEDGCTKAAGCAAVVLDFPGSVFTPRAPHPAPPRCVPSEGALSFTHTLIRTVSTAKTHFTHHQARKLHSVCLLFL